MLIRSEKTNKGLPLFHLSQAPQQTCHICDNANRMNEKTKTNTKLCSDEYVQNLIRILGFSTARQLKSTVNEKNFQMQPSKLLKSKSGIFYPKIDISCLYYDPKTGIIDPNGGFTGSYPKPDTLDTWSEVFFVHGSERSEYISCLTILFIFTAIFQPKAWIKRSILSVLSER